MRTKGDSSESGQTVRRAPAPADADARVRPRCESANAAGSEAAPASGSAPGAGEGSSGELASWRSPGLFVAAIVLSVACFQVFPGDDPASSLAQGAALSVIVLAIVRVGCPEVLRRSRKAVGPLGWWAAFVLAVGLAAGVALWLLSGSAGFLGSNAVARAAYVLALCLMTGLFEEGVFRVLALDALLTRVTPLHAAVASAVLFGLLHASFGQALAVGDAVGWAQAVLKPVQAGLFGFFMAALYLKGGSLWFLAGIHAAFDLVYLGPTLFSTGVQPAYVTGGFGDAAVLAATTLLLFASARAAWLALRVPSEASSDS